MVGVWKEGMLCAHQFTLPLCPSSESGPEPCLPGGRISVLPAFQPLYPPNHVNQWHHTLLPCASGYCPSLFPICPPTAPSLHFVDQAILRAWTLIDSGGNRGHLRHQEELLPMAPLGMDPAEQSN